MSAPDVIAQPLVERLRADIAGRAEPVVVALDGRSGSGKSTIAAAVAHALDIGSSRHATVTVIEGDDFYAGGSAPSWDRRTAAEKAAHVIDWARQRRLLEQLREHGEATWSVFDWDADDWDADVVPMRSDPMWCQATRVVILEGAYSARPELADLLDLRVLLDPPTAVRRRQLMEREGEGYRADWESRWSEAEDHYFGNVMPPARFDLVLRPHAAMG